MSFLVPLFFLPLFILAPGGEAPVGWFEWLSMEPLDELICFVFDNGLVVNELGIEHHAGDAFGDIFGDIFGGGGRRSNVYRGADLRYNMEISLEDAARGTETKIRIPVMSKCEPCNGTGAKAGTSPVTCTTCHGHGQVRMQQGFFSVQQTCPTCHGNGKMVKDPCPECNGGGRVKQHKTLSVKIPAGVDEGDRIRLSGEVS